MLKTRKMISMLLVVAMVLSIFAIGVVSTAAASSEGEGFYLAGGMNGWQPTDGYKFTKNEAADTEEYYLNGITIGAADGFKIAYSGDGSAFADSDWYPDGMGNDLMAPEDGNYNIYFRPNGDGNDDWLGSDGKEHKGKMIYFEKVGEADPQDPSDDPDPYVPGEMITVYFTNTKSWSEVNCYYWINGGELTWPGEAASFYETNELGQDVYSASIDSNAVGVIFNGDGNSNSCPYFTTATSGAIAYADMIQLWSKLSPYQLNVILAPTSAMTKILSSSCSSSFFMSCSFDIAVMEGTRSPSQLISSESVAFKRALSKFLSIAMISPVAFICVPSLLEAVLNLSNGHLGIFTTQ